ncbi:MAG TPA: carboxy-S-adenosyl-L-methionine synthase CmoA [Polyangiaceae bacterium]|nr:carboxy-S-adenosyl-L-methionine synthase CmoA [Polyangiaceae bacterium]
MARDDLFTRTAPGAGEFRFDEAVARVLPDMLRRSIPGYHTLLELLGVLARDVVPAGGRVYDLGCSHGAVSAVIRGALGERTVRCVGVDSSPAMIDEARKNLAGFGDIELHCADVRDFEPEPASLVVLNFTLQFVPPDERSQLLARWGAALDPGGILVLSEKVAEVDGRFAQLHDAFREANGYSQLEMSRKRRALENVLIPDTVEEHEARLRGAGLEPRQWFRALHFVSFLAQKPPSQP